MADGDKARELQVVLVGDTNVGKSALLLRFVADIFRPYIDPTIGASILFKTIIVDDTPVKCMIWDTSGQEKSLASMFYRTARAAIVVYDITQKQSLESLRKWVQHVRRACSNEIAIAVVGNKSDLEAKRQVSKADAREYAEEIGALFFETSAKEDANVSDIFIQVTRALSQTSAERGVLATIVNLFGGGQTKGSCW